MTYALLLVALLVTWALNTRHTGRRRPAAPTALRTGFWDHP